MEEITLLDCQHTSYALAVYSGVKKTNHTVQLVKGVRQNLIFSQEMISRQKQPSCKKKVQPCLKMASIKKSCEIQAGGQEMAVMVG